MRLLRLRLLAAPAAVLLLVVLSASMSTAGANRTVPRAAAPCGPAGPPCPTPPMANSPLIQISKSASPTSLPAGGGSVTYTYTVTNGGNVPLSGIIVTDNTCAPVTYVSGDTNGNTILDLSETWTFTCTTTITATTTNTAIAQGVDPSGLGTAATATATVTVECSPLAGANCTPPPTCPPGSPNCPSPTPSPTPCPPTSPNCPPGSGTICVLKFNDLNGNGSKAATDPPLGGVVFTITPAVGPAQTTPATGQVCWKNVPPGTYTITESGPGTTSGWVPTTPTSAPSTSQTVSIALAGATLNLRFGDHKFLIDHFECYRVTPIPVRPAFTGISLKDQFASWTAIAFRRISLCNPVLKALQGSTVRIINPAAHLVCYLPAIKQPVPPPPTRTVRVTNQFGNDFLQVLQPVSLCLPSSKSVVANQYRNVPTTLDHYLCYAVKDLTPRDYKLVTLADQFGRGNAQVIAPVALCVPVQKTYKNITTKIINRVDHLVCYTIATAGFQPRPVWINNQFERVPLRVVKPFQLCVPSLKQVRNAAAR